MKTLTANYPGTCRKCGATAMEMRHCTTCKKAYCVVCYTGKSVFAKT